jgi:hypothetical protein
MKSISPHGICVEQPRKNRIYIVKFLQNGATRRPNGEWRRWKPDRGRGIKVKKVPFNYRFL